MKIILALLLSLAVGGSVQSQQSATAEEAIGRIINSGLLEGHDQKVISGMADAAAVVVTKVVGEKTLTPSQIERVLLILNSAFADVDSKQGKDARTSLFVLEHLKLLTTDSELQKRIERTRKYVLDQTTAVSK